MEFKVEKRVVSLIKPEDITPEMQEEINRVQAKFAKQMQDDIAASFGIPRSVIDTGTLQSNISTVSSMASAELNKDVLDKIMKLLRQFHGVQQKSIEERLFDEIMKSDLNADNLERCRIALFELDGLEVINKIPLKRLTMASVVEALLKIYHDFLSKY